MCMVYVHIEIPETCYIQCMVLHTRPDHTIPNTPDQTKVGEALDQHFKAIGEATVMPDAGVVFRDQDGDASSDSGLEDIL